MSDVATRETFLTGCRRRYGTLILPVAGITVRFQSLNAGEMAAYDMEAWTRDEEGKLTRNDAAVANAGARLIVACLVDGEGSRLLCDGDLEQVELLDAADMETLYEELRRHTGIERRVQAAAADSAKKN